MIKRGPLFLAVSLCVLHFETKKWTTESDKVGDKNARQLQSRLSLSLCARCKEESNKNTSTWAVNADGRPRQPHGEIMSSTRNVNFFLYISVLLSIYSIITPSASSPLSARVTDVCAPSIISPKSSEVATCNCPL